MLFLLCDCFQIKDLKGSDIPTLESSFQSLNTEMQKLSAEIAEVIHSLMQALFFFSITLVFSKFCNALKT